MLLAPCFPQIAVRAQSRGEIRATADLDVILDLLSSYVLYQLLVKPPSLAFRASLDRMLDLLFHGLVAPVSD